MWIVKYLTFDYNGELLAQREFDTEAEAQEFANRLCGTVEKMKEFECTWGDGYANQETQVLTFDDINEENGWDDEYIHMIDMAQVGDVVDCSDYSGVLHVKRIA